MKQENVLIMGAAGRDFFNFMQYYKKNKNFTVKAFTAAQIPDIAGRTFPAALAGRRYPKGIPIYPETELTKLIYDLKIDTVVLSYSDLSHQTVMEKASHVLAAGASFALLSPDAPLLYSKKPVISVCAVRTGSGKSQTTRFIAQYFMKHGYKPVVIRHPMPYGDLMKQRCQRFATENDMDRAGCTIEEREEYEHLTRNGIVVYAGVDYEMILKRAEKEADLIIFDGGNNDVPFIKSNLAIVIADPLRAGHEISYYPGYVNLLLAHVVVINKVNSANRKTVEELKKTIRHANPMAHIVPAYSVLHPSNTESIARKKVLIIEDGPTLTHGGMLYGAATVYAQTNRAHIVDPEPYAVGSIRDIYGAYPHLRKVLPAMGYSKIQIKELQDTINRVPCDFVVSATPIDLGRIITVKKPIIQVSYKLDDIQGKLTDLLSKFEKTFIRK